MTATDVATLHTHFDLPPRRRMSHATTIAIGASVVVHLALGAYIYRAKFRQAPLVAETETPTTTIDFFHLHREPPPPPTKPEHPVRQLQVRESTSAPPLGQATLPMDPVPDKHV